MRQRKAALDYEIGVAGALYVLLNFIVSLTQGRTEGKFFYFVSLIPCKFFYEQEGSNQKSLRIKFYERATRL
jgi:hypothetical protein